MRVESIKRLWIVFSDSTDITSENIDNIVKVQEEVRIKLDHLEVKLDRILKKLFPEEVKLKRPRGIPAFPLRTEKKWENLEEILADDDVFTYVVNILRIYSIFNCLQFYIFPFVSYFPITACFEKTKIINNINSYVKIIVQVDVIAAKIKNQESETAAVQSVLPKIITNSLSRVISWGGTQKTKIAFKKSKTYEVIQGDYFSLYIVAFYLQTVIEIYFIF